MPVIIKAKSIDISKQRVISVVSKKIKWNFITMFKEEVHGY
jgi:hypothetical protein